jgi:hypothetical protein
MIPDQGGVGRAVAKYALSVLAPSAVIALSNQLMLKTIPATGRDQRAIHRGVRPVLAPSPVPGQAEAGQAGAAGAGRGRAGRGSRASSR